MSQKKTRPLELYLLLAGLVLFGISIWAVGFEEQFAAISPAFRGWGLSFLFMYPFIAVWNVLGWRLAFSSENQRKGTFGKLYLVRLAGQAVNNITPFIDVGGEFLKIHLGIHKLGIARRSMVASVILERSLLLFSEIAFWVLGLLLASFYLSGSDIWSGSVMIVIILFAGFSLALWGVQRRGFFLTFVHWLEKTHLKPAFFDKHRDSLLHIDKEIVEFYSNRGNRLVKSLTYHVASWIGGGIEMWLFFKILGSPITIVEGIMFEAMLQLLRTITFFIPGNLGAQEAGMALIAQSVGIHSSVGVAVSILKRVRQLFWTGAGFGVWAYFQWRGKSILDTDTPLDFLIHRPVALWTARILAKTPVTPNFVTSTALVTAFMAAGFFSRGDFISALLGLACFYGWSVLDHTDGELARSTGRTSEFGQWLDDICDTIASATILTGLFLGALRWIPADGQPFFIGLFLPALFLNAYFGNKVVETRQIVRRWFHKTAREDSRFINSQNTLDHFTGREPFYLLQIWAIVCFYLKLPWVYTLANLLIGGCAFFGIGYFLAERGLRVYLWKHKKNSAN